MPTGQELQVQEKRELQKKDESTIPARAFVPTATLMETIGVRETSTAPSDDVAAFLKADETLKPSVKG